MAFPLRSIVASSAIAAVAIAAPSLGASQEDGNVSVRYSATDPSAGLFPSDRYTVTDNSQLSKRRVSLPKPDCAVRVSDCQDVDVLNTLDGFSLFPRFTVSFTGSIDPKTVTSDSVFLLEVGGPDWFRAGRKIGINEVAWDEASKTLNFRSDEFLLEHTRYLVVVTNGVRDARGKRLNGGDWIDTAGRAVGKHAEAGNYRKELRQALDLLPSSAGRPVAASLFTTQSATADLAKMARQAKLRTPAPIDFAIASTQNGAPARAVLNVSDVTRMVWRQQTGTEQFRDTEQALSALQVVPNSIGRVAYGYFSSPNYLAPGQILPATGTATGVPQPRGEDKLLVQIFVPSGQKPAGGWPVVIFGHGLSNNLFGAPWSVASVFASYGLATAAINVVGHGGGPKGSLQVDLAGGGSVALPAAGRALDLNQDGLFAAFEGATATAPNAIIGSRDALRQTVSDLMQLVRQFETGVDIDGDGVADFNGRRVSYSGQSFGGVYGTMLMGVEPSIVAGVPNVGGGDLIEATRLGSLRSLRAASLAGRTPSLINLPPLPNLPAPANLQFDENMPLRNQPPLTKQVPGAQAIAEVFERSSWAQQAGVAAAYAPLIRKRPLPGNAPKPIIFQFAKGDKTMPNPTSSLVARAGDFADRVSYFRNDLAHAANPALNKDPHVFLTAIGSPAGRPYAIAGQQMIGAFLSSDGTNTVDPDGAQGVFEMPVIGPLPDELNFIP